MSTDFYVYETQAKSKEDIGMREIKFRAWTEINETHRMIGWDALHLEKSEVGLLLWIGDDGVDHFGSAEGTGEFKLMQYTGLKDKNGREIYEGDVITFIRKKDVMKDVITFSLGGFGTKWWCLADLREIKVLGNIYENPELLEVTT